MDITIILVPEKETQNPLYSYTEPENHDLCWNSKHATAPLRLHANHYFDLSPYVCTWARRTRDFSVRARFGKRSI